MGCVAGKHGSPAADLRGPNKAKDGSSSDKHVHSTTATDDLEQHKPLPLLTVSGSIHSDAHMPPRLAPMNPDSKEGESIALNDRESAQGSKSRRNAQNPRVKAASLIDQKYILTEAVLGTGVSGAVRIGLEKSTQKKYAIKTLNLENISSKKAAMLHNEVDIYLKLDHPNIVKLIEVFEDEKKIFLVMELCTGKELYDRLAAKKRYSELDAARVTQQMLEAINYCHKNHICHRDLKLENWVYASEAEDAHLKLIDFGFSRIFNPVIPMTAMHGTVYYVSPEVMDGCYREKCDIWSIGVIVFMLLSGTPPFNGTADYQILVKIRNGEYNFSAPVWNTVSDEAKDFVRSLLIGDPQKRPSAEEALKHRWLEQSSDNDEIDVRVLQAMKTFAVGNIMKRAALGLIARTFSDGEVQDLYNEFKKLDKDKTGTIRLQDMAAAMQEHLKVSPSEATRIFERIDQTGDRTVRYTDFLASTIHARMMSDDKLVREAFDRLDADQSGLITASDLKSVLGDTFNHVPVEQIIEAYDPSGFRGGLSFENFRKVFVCPDDFPLDDGDNETMPIATGSGSQIFPDGANDAANTYYNREHSVAIKNQASLPEVVASMHLRDLE